MTPLDWGIVAFAAMLALWGFGQGLLTGALTLGGFVGGAVLGSRIAHALLETGSASPYAPLISLLFALVLGAAAAAILAGIGSALRSVVSWGPMVAVDATLGAVLGTTLALGIIWVLGAVALQTPQLEDLRTLVQRSMVLRELNSRLPPSGPILNALARVDPFPRVVGPRADVPPPDSGILSRAGVKRAGDSVLRVLAVACGLGVQGSGWVAGNDLIVTNAHVVAGQSDTVVQSGTGGRKLEARVVHYDVRNDLALLRVQALRRPTLGLASKSQTGADAAVLGYPENGPYAATPARLGKTETVISSDAYGRGPVTRSITSFRGLVRHGNSGGPVVDATGRAVTTVFAAAGDASRGYGVPDTVVKRALDTAGKAEVGTGPCV